MKEVYKKAELYFSSQVGMHSTLLTISLPRNRENREHQKIPGMLLCCKKKANHA